jgi:zinc protease
MAMSNMANDVQSYELPNGLKIFVQEDHRAPVVVSQVWYKVGSSYEPNGITGISHALEHMMFKGTAKHGPGEFSRIIAENGGEENAFTSTDYTAYYQIMDASKLAISFEMEADRMRNLIVDQKEFEKEIQVVMEERRMRIEDSPQHVAYERFIAAANVSTGYHHLTIGWMNDIRNMTAKDLQKWYENWYGPNNALLVVVGDVKPDEVYKLAEKYFGELKPIELPVIKPQVELKPLGKQQLVVKQPAQLPWFIMGYNVPVIKTDTKNNDPYVLSMISAILSDGNSGRLDKHLVRNQQVAASISASYDPTDRLSGLFKFQGTPAQYHSVADVQKAVFEQINALKEKPVAANELEKVKAGVVAAKIYDKDAISNQATEIGSLESVGLSWKLRDEFIKHISAVTPAQIQEVARRYFIDDNLTVTELEPLPLSSKKSKGKGSPPAEPIGTEDKHTRVH